MISPYTAVGLIPTVRGIRRREDIKINLEHLAHLFKAASWLSSLDLPVRLIAIPEGGLQAFTDEVLDLDHVEFARINGFQHGGRSSGRFDLEALAFQQQAQRREHVRLIVSNENSRHRQSNPENREDR